MSLKVLGKRNLEVHVLLHSLLIQQAQRLIHTLRHHNGHGFAPNSGSSSCIHEHICEENSIFFLIISLRCQYWPTKQAAQRPCKVLHTLHSHRVLQLRAPCSPSPSFPFPSGCSQINCWESPLSGAQPPPACCCFRCSAPAHSPPLTSWIARSFGSD